MQLSKFSHDMRPSPLPSLLARASHPEVISFAVGFPGTELLPRAAYAAAGAELLGRGGEPLQYSVPQPELKRAIAEKILVERGVHCRPEQIFLCTGAQQGLALLGLLLLDPGAEVLLETIVYDGIRGAISSLHPRVLAVPTDLEEGPDLAAIEAHLDAGARPAFLYVISDGQNPLGYSLSVEKRERLVELARRRGLPIVEDDACGYLTYDEPPWPALRSFDDEWVLYVGSFSKILGPSLRIGWIVVPEELIPKLSMLKHAMDCDTATYSQHLAAGFVVEGDFRRHLGSLRKEYGARRDAVIAALERHMPAGSRWSHPRAGLYIWLELPEGSDTTALLETAIDEEKVAFSPGFVYAAEGDEASCNHALRLSFGNLSVGKIEEGVERLARAVRRLLA